jgi:hypothetical protein
MKMKKEAGSAYRIAKTRENLFEFSEKSLALDKNSTYKALKRAGIDEKFDSSHWDKYVEILTGHPPCQFCGAPRIYQERFWGVFHSNGYVCSENVSHAYGTRAQRTLDITVSAGRRTKDQVERMLNKECQHGDLEFFCKICIQEAIEKRFPPIIITALQVGEGQ